MISSLQFKPQELKEQLFGPVETKETDAHSFKLPLSKKKNKEYKKRVLRAKSKLSRISKCKFIKNFSC